MSKKEEIEILEEEVRLQELKVKKQQLDKKEKQYFDWYIKDFIKSSFWGLIILGILWFLFQTC